MSPPITVPFLSLRDAYLELKQELDEAVSRALDSGHYILGPEVDAFESEFAQWTGAKACVGVGNGLDALVLGLRALGVGPGDDVLVPSNTFIATWLAVTQLGARPVPVEPDEETLLVTPAAMEQALTARTRALVPVHLYGQPCDMEGFVELASRRKVALLDDAAQAHGAEYRGRRIGAWGRVSAWSFYPGKNLGAFGDAGALTTNDEQLADRLRRFRNYGSVEKYVHEVIGQNSRLDPVQAAVLRVKLRTLDAWNERRRAIAAIYERGLAGIPTLKLPVVHPDARHVFHLYVVRTPQRNRLRVELERQGIQTLIHYPRAPHQQAAYAGADLGAPDLARTERLHDEVLSLPIGPHLQPAQAETVAEAIRKFFGVA